MKLPDANSPLSAARSKTRSLLLIALLAVLGVGISYVAFDGVNRHHAARLAAEFERDVNRRIAVLEQELAQSVERLRSIASFFLSSEQVSEQEFRDFTASYLRQRAGLALVAWARADFSAAHETVVADSLTAGVTLPVVYLEPGPAGMIGFETDLASVPGLTAAVETAFERGLVRHVLVEGGLLLVTPTLDFVDWSGVAVALLPFDTMAAWFGLDDWQGSLELTEQPHGRVILSRATETWPGEGYEATFGVGGEMWRVRAVPHGAPGVPAGAWATLVAGCVITGLLAFLMFTLASSAERATALVRLRTRELEQAEAEARSQAVRLADEVTHSTQLIASIPSLLIGVDRDGVVKEWNRAIAGLSGIPLARVKGKALRECCWQGDLDSLCAGVEQCLSQQQTVRRNDLHFVNAHAADATIGVTYTPMLDSEDELVGCLIVGADVTERNAMEIQLRESQRLEAVGRLAAGIAHEVNTPAQFVSDNTSFLKDAFDDLLALEAAYSAVFDELGDSLDATRREAVEKARQTADRDYLAEEVPQALEQSMDGIRRIADIVRAMKEFSHPGGGGAKEQVDFNRLIRNAITVAANEWKYHATVETELDESLPALPCYPRELNQVVLNLLINAAHAIADRNRDSGDRGEIRIVTDVVDNCVRMRVSDTGTGIPEAVRNKIFEPFFTTKEVGRGSGQGLALAYSAVVEKHGGTLKFETELGVGTTFHVHLPLKTQEAAA